MSQNSLVITDVEPERFLQRFIETRVHHRPKKNRNSGNLQTLTPKKVKPLRPAAARVYLHPAFASMHFIFWDANAVLHVKVKFLQGHIYCADLLRKLGEKNKNISHRNLTVHFH